TRRALDEPFNRQVFAKRSPSEFRARELLAPPRIMLGRIGVDRLIDATMDGQVRLLVAVEVQRANTDTFRHRILEDRRHDDLASDREFMRTSHIDWTDFHHAARSPL